MVVKISGIVVQVQEEGLGDGNEYIASNLPSLTLECQLVPTSQIIATVPTCLDQLPKDNLESYKFHYVSLLHGNSSF